MGRRAARLFAGLLALAAASIAAAQEPAATLFPSDQRLSRAITVERGHIFLGELLEQLSRDTGVNLSVDTQRAPLDGITLTAYLEDRPLREVLGGLATLFTTPYDRWDWRPQQTGYRLYPSRAPADAAAAAQQDVRTDWSAQVREFHEIAQLPEDARRERLAGLRHLHYEANDHLLPLLGALDSAALNRLMADGTPIRLDLTTLPPPALAAYRTLAAPVANEPPDPTRQPAIMLDFSAGTLGPLLMASFDGLNPHASILGSRQWDNYWLRDKLQGWRAGGDPEAQQAGEAMRQAQRDGEMRGNLELNRGKPIVEWLKEIHERQGVALVAEFGKGARGAYPWLGATPEDTLLGLAATSNYVFRQEGGLYTIRDPQLLLDDGDHLIEWRRIARLREAAQMNDESLPLNAFLELADLSEAQIRGLTRQFHETPAFESWSPILQFVTTLTPASRQKLLSDAGLPWVDTGQTARNALLAARQSFGPALERALEPGPQNIALRLRTQKTNTPIESLRTGSFSGGTLAELRAARQAARNPPPRPDGSPAPTSVRVYFETLSLLEDPPRARPLTSGTLPILLRLTPP